MPNYKETEITSGNSFVRAAKVEIFNHYQSTTKTIRFQEEHIISIGNETIRRPYNRQTTCDYSSAVTLSNTLTEETANTSFNLLNPVDNSVVGTMTYQDVYNVLYSLYIHTATEFDNNNPPT